MQTIGALPLPPSLWHWDGLVRTHEGYTKRELISAAVGKASRRQSEVPRSHSNIGIIPTRLRIPSSTAKRLPAVQTVLWFARFPVTRFHKEGGEAIVEISDLRFPHLRPDRPASFTYRVRFNAAGNVFEQGWAKDKP